MKTLLGVVDEGATSLKYQQRALASTSAIRLFSDTTLAKSSPTAMPMLQCRRRGLCVHGLAGIITPADTRNDSLTAGTKHRYGDFRIGPNRRRMTMAAKFEIYKDSRGEFLPSQSSQRRSDRHGRRLQVESGRRERHQVGADQRTRRDSG